MKLLLILTSSILLLSSCTQYRYDVTYEKCNGLTGSVSIVSQYGPPRISNYRTAVPELYYNQGAGGKQELLELNVCDFSYQRNPIE